MRNRRTFWERWQRVKSGDKVLVILLCLVLFCMLPVTLYAHAGGFPRLNGVEAGAYRVYAWTLPNPWLANEDLHLSVAVTQVDTAASVASGPAPEALVTDAAVTAQFHPPDHSNELSVSRVLSATESLGGIYYEADLRLPATGDWRVDVAVVGPLGSGNSNFVVTVLPGRQVNWWLIGGGATFILLLLAVAAIMGRR